MFEWLKTHFTSIVAITGFIISVCTFAETRLTNRTCFTVKIEQTFLLRGRLLLVLSIVNKSRLPITLTSCKLTINRKEYYAGIRSSVWYTYVDPAAKGRSNEHSTAFPIKIESLGYFYGNIEVPDWNEPLPVNCEFDIGTNRRALKFDCELPAPIGDYQSLLKCLK